MADGFAVDRAALTETAQGINDTINALQPLGIEESAGVGRGFSGLALSGLETGDATLCQAFGAFCDRWSWGVRALVQDGNQFASRLGITAGVYADTEDYLTGVAKDVLDSVAGDPHMSDAQATAASWSQDAGEVTGASDPDGNMTWAQAGHQAAQQWDGVGRDALAAPPVIGPPVVGPPGSGEVLGWLGERA